MERTPNREQERVINDFAKNIILYASAGTGKTFTVAQKVKKIIENGLAKPEEILCLTFTIKACDEMRDDISSYNENAKNIEVRTIHSFCYQIVKEESKRASDNYIEPVICDDVDQEEILQKLVSNTITRLKLEKCIQKLNFAKNVEDLFKYDTVYLTRRATSLYNESFTPTENAKLISLFNQYKSGFFRKVNYNDELYYLLPSGFVRKKDVDCFMTTGSVFACPECKSKQTQNGNFCSECGYDFRTYFPSIEFPLGKYSGYRNLISMLKHYRVISGFKTENETEDYQNTFNQLKELNPKSLEKVFTYISARSEHVDKDLLADMENFAGEVLHEYQSLLRQSNRVDFDDLIIEARNFLIDQKICERWQQRYKYIIVDEMQDTSELEYDVLRRLFPHSQVMMCGDFFQTIYEWRGSNPRTVLDDYRKNFQARTYMLSENYRSTELLTSASFGYLKNTYPNDIGVFCPQNIVIANKKAGNPIRFIECNSAENEAAFIFRYLMKHPVDDPTEICIMARSNNYINKLWSFFNDFNESLPAEKRQHFFTVRQDYRFFKTPIVKDMLAFWTLLVSPDDALSMDRIAEKYIYGVGPATITSIQEKNFAGLSLCSFLKNETYTGGDPYRTLIDAVNWGNVVVYDTETTGLDLGKDQIIQIAAMKMDRSGKCVQEFMRFVIPTTEISKGALNTHGYSLEFLKSHGGLSITKALKEFSQFVRGAVLVGHNSAKFDRAVVDRQLSECGLPPLDIKGEYDTLTLAKLLYPKLKNHKLNTLCETFGIVNERAHDAFSDVEATAKVLSYFVTERLEPQASVREKAVRRYKNRFKPFYEHYLAMHKFLSLNDLNGLNKYVTNNFKIFEHYNEDFEKDSLEVLMLLAKEKYSIKTSLEITVRDLLAEAALAGSEMDVLIKKLNKIPIITVHQSKGCEFDTVILAGVDNFMFPIASAAKAKREDEEKRVFYVAISRAKDNLIMTCHGSNSDIFPRLPSSYVSKIPQNYIEWYIYDGKTTRRRQ